jgi:hypothetical protein
LWAGASSKALKAMKSWKDFLFSSPCSLSELVGLWQAQKRRKVMKSWKEFCKFPDAARQAMSNFSQVLVFLLSDKL